MPPLLHSRRCSWSSPQLLQRQSHGCHVPHLCCLGRNCYSHPNSSNQEKWSITCMMLMMGPADHAMHHTHIIVEEVRMGALHSWGIRINSNLKLDSCCTTTAHRHPQLLYSRCILWGPGSTRAEHWCHAQKHFHCLCCYLYWAKPGEDTNATQPAR